MDPNSREVLTEVDVGNGEVKTLVQMFESNTENGVSLLDWVNLKLVGAPVYYKHHKVDEKEEVNWNKNMTVV